MVFSRLLCMIEGVQTVCVGYVRVMSRLFVVARCVMHCRFRVVMRSLRVVMSRLLVMIGCFL
jgi:hypothetical protein